MTSSSSGQIDHQRGGPAMGADGGIDIEVFSNEEANIFIVQFLSASWREKCGWPVLRLGDAAEATEPA